MCTCTPPQLAVDLALAFDGEVVSADSMQLYSGLPIVTNAVTEQEMQGVPHHLVGCVPPSTATTVHHFVALALPVIDGIRARGKLVVVVGGTNYYIEAVLFRTLQSLGDPLAAPAPTAAPDAAASRSGPPPIDTDGAAALPTAAPRPFRAAAGGGKKTQPVLPVTPVLAASAESSAAAAAAGTPTRRPKSGLPPPSLHAQLAEIDPVMAERLHPNDTRKIARSIEVYQQTGE